MTIRWLHGREPNEPVARRGLGATIVFLATVAGLLYAGSILERSPFVSPAFAAAAKHVPATPANKRPTTHSSSQNDAQYVGSQACSRCHAEIYNHYTRTSMGRSITPVTPEFIRTLSLPASVYDHNLDRHFETIAKDGRLLQSEYAVNPSGKETFRNTQPVEWIIGANLNGFGALISRDDYLFEAPLSYYTQAAAWELSPGYQRGDYGFNRAIAPGCIFCHSGRPQPVANTDGQYRQPAFTQAAIGCENCHGPGSAHVASMGDGESYPAGQDPNIVNPARIKPGLANDLCESCHQTGDARVFQPGKTYLDFRPGQPLDRVLAILIVPPTRDTPPNEDHVQHYYSMIMSKCYQASLTLPEQQQLRCISCHDPHIEPAAQQAPAYFNAKCLTCHTGSASETHTTSAAAPALPTCKAPVEVRNQTLASTGVADNCISCHMPRRSTGTISHSALTNHRIIARPNEPFPDLAFNQTTPDLPNLIYLNRSPGASRPADVTLLQAYDQLRAEHPVYEAAWLQTLTELQQAAPDSPADQALVQAALGHQYLKVKRIDQAIDHLQQSLALNPAQAAVYADLSEAADAKGDPAQAISMAQKAVTLDPWNAALQKSLVLRLINGQRYPEAEAAMVKYLDSFPQDDFMRKMLAIARQ